MAIASDYQPLPAGSTIDADGNIHVPGWVQGRYELARLSADGTKVEEVGGFDSREPGTAGGPICIPLAGTAANQPVTGDVEFDESVGLNLKSAAGSYHVYAEAGQIQIDDATGQLVATINNDGISIVDGRAMRLGLAGIFSELSGDGKGGLLLNGQPFPGGPSGTPRDPFAVGDVQAITDAVTDTSNTWNDGDLAAYGSPALQDAGAPPAVAGQNSTILVGTADVVTLDEFDMTDSTGSAWRYRYGRRNDGTSGWTRTPKG